MFRWLAASIGALGVALGISNSQAAGQVLRFPAVGSTTIGIGGPVTSLGDTIALGGASTSAPSFVVLDFVLDPPAKRIVDVTSATLELSHADITLREAGVLNTYFPTTQIDPPSLAFNTNLADGIGGQFNIGPLLSSMTYQPLAATVKEVAIQDLEAVKDGIRDYYLDDPEQFRLQLVIAPGSTRVSALFAAVGDPAIAPTLVLNYVAVPEPGSVVVMMTIAIATGVYFRRQAT